ncbi:MAG: nucleotidyltransferase family protein [Bacteroidales bacterium]|nr:nucleotidyltransferase family protein [Bacteroidales bacterium]
MKAMIFAAGLGTRLKPITNKIPKALVEINGKPLLELIIRKLIHYKFDEIIINVHHFSNQIIEFLEQNKYFGINIHVSDESKKLLDTGGGLKKASYFFNDNKAFLVHNVDIISDINFQQFIEYHNKSGALATLAVRNRNTSRYFLFDNKMNLCGWENKIKHEKITKPTADKFKNTDIQLVPFAFSGIHIIEPRIFSLIEQKGKFSIVDVYLNLMEEHKIIGYDHTNDLWLDVGNKINLETANKLPNL